MAALFHSPVFFILAAVYSLAILLGSFLVMSAERRHRWQQRTNTSLTATYRWLSAQFLVVTQSAWSTPSRVMIALSALRAITVRHRQKIVLCSAVLVTPVLLVHLLAPQSATDYTDDTAATTDPVIVALLHGEQLVPPPELPPKVFLTREVEAQRHEIAAANREWSALATDFRQRLLTVFRLMERHGYRMTLIEGYRSPERQTLLAQFGPQVTNAGAFQSYHQYGLAADSAFFRDGRIVISERDPWAMDGYRLFGQYAESVGLVWGGRWEMRDLGHVELRTGKVLKQ